MQRKLLPVQLDQTWILVDASAVREVLAAEAWTTIPGATPELPGVLAWRGKAVPVLDLASSLGLTPSEAASPRRRTLLFDVGQSTVAVPVDHAREVVGVAAAEVVEAGTGGVAHSSGEVDLNGTLMSVIDVRRLVDDLAQALLGDAGEASA